MKLKITEEFLWTLYGIIEGIDDVFYILFPQPFTIKRAVFPEYYEMKRIYEKKRERKNFAKLVSYLKKKGWIKIKELEEKKALLLTPKGKEKVLKLRKKYMFSLPKKKRKDGKLIMVAFDIPERKRAIRNYFREKLLELGFQKFQESIWMCPYDVLEEVKEIIQNLKLEEQVKIFLIEETEV